MPERFFMCYAAIMIVAGLSAAGPAGNAVIRNETVWQDTAGNEIWCNGGNMIRQNSTFWWVGYETRPGAWNWNIKLYWFGKTVNRFSNGRRHGRLTAQQDNGRLWNDLTSESGQVTLEEGF